MNLPDLTEYMEKHQESRHAAEGVESIAATGARIGLLFIIGFALVAGAFFGGVTALLWVLT